MNRPDLHHEGPITVELIDGLIDQMNERAGQLPLDMFVEGKLTGPTPATTGCPSATTPRADCERSGAT